MEGKASDYLLIAKWSSPYTRRNAISQGIDNTSPNRKINDNANGSVPICVAERTTLII
jgi:hypothetical protein